MGLLSSKMEKKMKLKNFIIVLASTLVLSACASNPTNPTQQGPQVLDRMHFEGELKKEFLPYFKKTEVYFVINLNFSYTDGTTGRQFYPSPKVTCNGEVIDPAYDSPVALYFLETIQLLEEALKLHTTPLRGDEKRVGHILNKDKKAFGFFLYTDSLKDSSLRKGGKTHQLFKKLVNEATTSEEAVAILCGDSV